MVTQGKLWYGWIGQEYKSSLRHSGGKTFSKMAAEKFNKSKLKVNTSTRKNTLTLLTLPSFSISGEKSAEKT